VCLKGFGESWLAPEDGRGMYSRLVSLLRAASSTSWGRFVAPV